jgi:hypothetical protein
VIGRQPGDGFEPRLTVAVEQVGEREGHVARVLAQAVADPARD